MRYFIYSVLTFENKILFNQKILKKKCIYFLLKKSIIIIVLFTKEQKIK